MCVCVCVCVCPSYLLLFLFSGPNLAFGHFHFSVQVDDETQTVTFTFSDTFPDNSSPYSADQMQIEMLALANARALKKHKHREGTFPRCGDDIETRLSLAERLVVIQKNLENSLSRFVMANRLKNAEEFANLIFTPNGFHTWNWYLQLAHRFPGFRDRFRFQD